mmetsp:Transcript_54188/g.171968  ORF Transcript_54188/g.171968 Transcript_54188/m.171968 type:complete len:356 (-) Transcript_54188:21-1088(-)
MGLFGKTKSGSAPKAPVRVGVNGFGRIGRLAFRLAWDDPAIEIVHVNEGVGSCDSSAYLVKYDSIHGTWEKEVEAEGDDAIMCDGKKLTYTRCTSPGEVDWAKFGVEVVMECSGKFLTRAKLQPFFDNGVKKVLVSAPVKDADPVLNIVVGCNDDQYDPSKDHIVTAASCTTNCLAPVVKVVNECFGIVRGSITTIHNVTNTQTVVDAPNSKKDDLRRARSAMTNLAPTSTGSATAIALIFPELKGKLNGLAVRVPILNGSLTDCVFELAKAATPEEVNAKFEEYANGQLKGILGYEKKPLVSCDYINDKRSGIVDALSTMVVDGTHLKVYAWYDNEYGYSQRMADILSLIASHL